MPLQTSGQWTPCHYRYLATLHHAATDIWPLNTMQQQISGHILLRCYRELWTCLIAVFNLRAVLIFLFSITPVTPLLLCVNCHTLIWAFYCTSAVILHVIFWCFTSYTLFTFIPGFSYSSYLRPFYVSYSDHILIFFGGGVLKRNSGLCPFLYTHHSR